MYGGVGVDTLTGGTGRDSLYAGVDNDADTFIFDGSEGLVDQIYEFKPT